MIFTTLMIASLLSVGDPSGDALGAGELSLPKAAVFRELANFDVLNLSIADQNTFAFEISMASLENPWDLPLGFSLPIIEVYAAISPIKSDSSMKELLPGSEMSLRNNSRWNYAFRITGNAIDVYTVENGEVRNIADNVDLSYTVSENRIFVETGIRLLGDISVYAMSGSYDPFSKTGWREIVSDEGTSAFSDWMLIASTQNPPVLDVVVDDFAMQKRAIQSRILPEITASARQPRWLWLVVAGLLSCLLALILRPKKLVAAVIDDSDTLDNPKTAKTVGFSENHVTSTVEEQDIEDSVQYAVAETRELEQGFVTSKNSEKAIEAGRPIQWTSWEEGEFGAEDTMKEFDRIANEEKVEEILKEDLVEARAPQPPSQTSVESPEAQAQKPVSTQFQENLLPDIDDEDLLSSKQPPKGFSKRVKTFGLGKSVVQEISDDDDDQS